MVIFKNGKLSKKEKVIIESILIECNDPYGDAYITKSNLRLFIRENINLVYEGLTKGDKIYYEDNEGFIFVCGFSDKASRKYLKILTKDDNATNKLLKSLQWNIKQDLYIKLKKNNPTRRVLERNGFHFAGDRGREILLCRKYIPSRPIRYKEIKEDNE